jgi:hypothetical protein
MTPMAHSIRRSAAPRRLGRLAERQHEPFLAGVVGQFLDAVGQGRADQPAFGRAFPVAGGGHRARIGSEADQPAGARVSLNRSAGASEDVRRRIVQEHRLADAEGWDINL